MKHALPISITASLAAALLIVGCTINSTDTSTGSDAGTNTNTDAGTSDPDGSTPQNDDGGSDADTPAQEVEETPGNDSLDTAQSVTVGSLIKANMTNDEEDFFALPFPAGDQDGVLSLTLDEADPDFRPGITLYSEAKSELVTTYADDGTTRPFSMTYNVTAGKKYYVKVHHGKSDATIPYTLQTGFTAAADTFERNDTFDTAKAAPAGQFDLILFAGSDTNGGDDVDFFTVDVTGKTKVRVQIENKSTAEIPQRHGVSLFGSDKSDIGTRYAANEQADLDETFDLPAGATSVFVKFFHGESSTVASKATITLE